MMAITLTGWPVIGDHHSPQDGQLLMVITPHRMASYWCPALLTGWPVIDGYHSHRMASYRWSSPRSSPQALNVIKLTY